MTLGLHHGDQEASCARRKYNNWMSTPTSVCGTFAHVHISPNMPFHPFQAVASHPFSVFLPSACGEPRGALFPPCTDPAARINKIRLLFLAANASRRTKCDSKAKKEMVNGVLAEPSGITLRRFNHLSRVWSCATSKKRRIEINDCQR